MNNYTNSLNHPLPILIILGHERTEDQTLSGSLCYSSNKFIAPSSSLNETTKALSRCFMSNLDKQQPSDESPWHTGGGSVRVRSRVGLS